ncbi:MAG: ribonuclease R [Candidatus Cloacimonetes bacterium]|nr:ribonuclease R [Candidatus Cloacimonadota bacterium]MCF7814106.1 ribonuclease R [Candidatus Cloacimonadota bacterium]MCF7867965.1 ribonuclease R [Candidatus Cloacimonadota bacterium]MCF7883423.1 ribonuclease R [Candidatus Cloacimonadota bacterium]
MFDKKLSHQVKKLLEDNPGKSFKLNEISKLIRVGKHKHKNLIDTLFSMVKEDQIDLKNRRYSVLKKRKKQTLSRKRAEKSDAKTMVGTFDATSLARNRSYAFVVSEEIDVFVSAEDTLTAYHDDKVHVELRYQRNGKVHGIITKIIERARTSVVGNLQEYHGKNYLIPDNSKIHTNFLVNDLKGANQENKVVLAVTNWGNREMQKLPAGTVSEILGKAGDPDVEILGVIKQFDLPLSFPDAVLEELKDLEEDISEDVINMRNNLRDLTTITIDPASAKDFDDAISLEKHEDGFDLYVHIADVAHYVKPNTQLFREAQKRGNSYYFPKKVIPMLPEKISNKMCSLRPYEEKLTVTVLTKFDLNYQITSQAVFESVIKSDARFNYEEIDDLFGGRKNNIDPKLAEMLQQMRKLSSHLQEKRKKQGYLHFDLPETEFIFDDEGHIKDLQRSRETESHKLIENFMLIANEYVARELSNRPTMFRIHEQPDEDRLISISNVVKKYDMKLNLKQSFNIALQQLLDSMPSKLYHRVFDRMILRSLKRAKYSVENLGHFGLAMPVYTHFTSPIRRLCDLVVHHQIKARINKRQHGFSADQLYDLTGKATEREQIADNSEREVEMKNKALFMKKHLGEEFDGVIVGMKPTGLIIEIDRYPITGVVDISSIKDDHYEYLDQYKRFVGRHNGKIYKLTDRVKILVSNVDDDIYFQLLEK